MKKTITLITLTLLQLQLNAQSYTESFESFTLSANSAYTSTNSIPFEGTSAQFQYSYNTAFDYWSGGFSYTNKYDSATAGFANMYGVKPLKGYNNSDIYVVGKDKGVIKLKSPYKGVEGMYLTNTTYAYKSMLLGDAFAKKFGGTSGNDPDFFKITIKGYLNGNLKSDSVEFYLADFRFSNNAQDYIVNTWQWVNTSSLGTVDSIRFFMYSSDVGSFGINTPLFFGVDNFTASPSFVGISEHLNKPSIKIYPNPTSEMIDVSVAEATSFKILNTNGQVVLIGEISPEANRIFLQELKSGFYFLNLNTKNGNQLLKIIKN